ncbi:hypothetical protein ACF0H5_012038 [Mactra antiquata]
MKLHLILFSALFLAVIIDVTYGVYCQFTNCDEVDCDVLPDNCTGSIEPGGGFCGCCKACFHYLDLGDDCEYQNYMEAVMYPATTVCGLGLYCEKSNSTCQVYGPSIG